MVRMDRRPGAHMLRDVVYALGAATGLVGTGFHLYNVLKRPGRLAWQNLSTARQLARLQLFFSLVYLACILNSAFRISGGET